MIQEKIPGEEEVRVGEKSRLTQSLGIFLNFLYSKIVEKSLVWQLLCYKNLTLFFFTLRLQRPPALETQRATPLRKVCVYPHTLQ